MTGITCRQGWMVGLTLAGGMLAAGGAQAATKDWSSTATSTSWTLAGNWSGGVPADSLTTDTARFNQTSYAFLPTAPGSRQVGGLVFGDGSTATAPVTILTGVQGGRLRVGAGGIVAYPGSGAVTIGNSAANQGINLGADQSCANNSSSLLYVRQFCNMNVADASTPYTLTLNGSGSGGTTIDMIYDGNLGASGSTVALVVNTTGGVTTLAGASAFSGGLTLSNGTVVIGNNSALGSTSNVVTLCGGTLDVTPSVTRTTAQSMKWNGDISFGTTNTGAGQLVINGPVTLGGTRTVTINGGGGFNVYGGISDNGAGYGLIKTGALMRLGGVNTYSGDTKVLQGTLTLWSNLALQNSAFDTSGAGNLTVSNGQTTPTFGGLKGPGNLDCGSFLAVSTSLTLNPGAGATCTYSGALSNSATNMALIKTGAGTQVLAGANSYGGPTVIGVGALQIGAGGTSGRLGAGDVTNSASLVFSRSDDLAVTNLIVGTGSLTKLGAGVLTLTATNAYSGATAVSNGVLRLTHAQSLAAGTDVSIAAGAKVRLDFTGTQVVHRLTVGGVLQTSNHLVGSAQLPAAIEGAGYLRPTDGAPTQGTLIRVQ